MRRDAGNPTAEESRHLTYQRSRVTAGNSDRNQAQQSTISATVSSLRWRRIQAERGARRVHQRRIGSSSRNDSRSSNDNCPSRLQHPPLLSCGVRHVAPLKCYEATKLIACYTSPQREQLSLPFRLSLFPPSLPPGAKNSKNCKSTIIITITLP